MLAPLRRAVRIPGFAAVTATLLPAYTLADALGRSGRAVERREVWVRRWAASMLRLFAIEAEVVGASAPTHGGRVVVMNHRSAIDTALALRIFGGRMVSRADLARWPLVGVAARRVGTVFVDRAAASSGAATIRTIRELVRSGESINVFPEGTTFPDDEVRPFHAGAFVAALGSGGIIVPAGVAYQSGSGAAFFEETFGAHLHRMAGAPKSRVVVAIGEPIAIEEGVRAKELVARAHQAVSALVRHARDRVDRQAAP
jgi:1-acyl-sn-glycerol-3-phosphate acyltransferase